MDTEFWSGLIEVLLIGFIAYKFYQTLDEYFKEQKELIINVGIALGMSKEDALHLSKEKEED